jgi:hypothetical protein
MPSFLYLLKYNSDYLLILSYSQFIDVLIENRLQDIKLSQSVYYMLKVDPQY